MENRKPTIGIIGGAGPLATLDIEQKILHSTQQLVAPLIDQDYFNLVVFNYSETYDRNDSFFFGKPNPIIQYKKYITSISSLGVDLILLACNTAHMYLPVLKKSTKTPILNIIEETVNYLRKTFPKCQKVGLLSTKTTQEKNLYKDLLSAHDIEEIRVSSSTQDSIMKAIYLIKAGIKLTAEEKILDNPFPLSKIHNERITRIQNHPYKNILLQGCVPNPKNIIKEAIKELKNKGCQHIIFGCTDLPLVIPYLDKVSHTHILDPNAITANSAVKFLYELEVEKLSSFIVLNSQREYI